MTNQEFEKLVQMSLSQNTGDHALLIEILEQHMEIIHPLWLRRLLTNICIDGEVPSSILQDKWELCQEETCRSVPRFYKADGNIPSVNYFRDDKTREIETT